MKFEVTVIVKVEASREGLAKTGAMAKALNDGLSTKGVQPPPFVEYEVKENI